MVLGLCFRYGVPLSFVYCTIYQQNIWREGDEKLILEQKRVWRDFFSMIDTGYNAVAAQLNLSSKDNGKLNLASLMDTNSMKACWNAHVMKNFAKIADAKEFNFDGWTKTLGLSK